MLCRTTRTVHRSDLDGFPRTVTKEISFAKHGVTDAGGGEAAEERMIDWGTLYLIGRVKVWGEMAMAHLSGPEVELESSRDRERRIDKQILKGTDIGMYGQKDK